MGATERSLTELSKALGRTFRRPALLTEALTHPSVAGPAAHGYQRLEFLGDRVLGLVVAELLLRRHPDDDEGALSRRYVALVRADTLADVAEEIDLGAHLVLSAGEAGAGGRANRALLADACEAVIGALYLDGGLAAAAAFIERHWSARLSAGEPARDAKTALQEWAQGRGLPLPRYRTLGRSGPDHAPVFTVEARVEGLPPATAEGPSKRAGEQAAAALLLAAARDAKTALQEWAQGRGLPLPRYRTLGRSGPDHAPVFTVEARVEGLPPATAEGPSKRAGEQAAAALLLAAAWAHPEAHDA